MKIKYKNMKIKYKYENWKSAILNGAYKLTDIVYSSPFGIDNGTDLDFHVKILRKNNLHRELHPMLLIRSSRKSAACMAISDARWCFYSS